VNVKTTAGPVALARAKLTRHSSGCTPARRPRWCWAWGITTSGKPAFIGLAPGTGESFDAWKDFLADLKDRGLASPLLIISDGAAGLIGAIEQIYPKALRQRCMVHRARIILAKVPAGMQAEVKDGYWKIFDTRDLTTAPGPELVEIIDARISGMAAKLRPTIDPKLPQPSHNLTMKPGPTPAHLHRDSGRHR
jgi:hypothetical protein